ncbi:MAG: hypothetical protein GWP08_16645 [Nitrospiraceae bacterium]|nr:hypothetical protein [Nitrospiraceae bacterium]
MMRNTVYSSVACMLLALIAVNAAYGDDPFADEVVTFVQGPNPPVGPYSDPSEALGAPTGGGAYTPDNNSIVSLGEPGGYLVLKFDTPVTDDPANPMGLDCIVFSNAFWVGGNPQRKLQEPALIEISEDVNDNGLADDAWYLIPGSRGFSYTPFPAVAEPTGAVNSEAEPLWLAGNIVNPNTLLDTNPANDSEQYNWGYADLSPTIEPCRDNYMRPQDPFTVAHTPGSGGGDAFDIAWAIDGAGAPAGISRFHFIRLTAFVTRDFGATGSASPEIDGVADISPDVDTDGDGVVDEYETRVVGTDPARSESTVLALELPIVEGGSPAGTLLGTAENANGDKIRLYSAGERDYGLTRNVTVDILPVGVPSEDLGEAGLLKSGTARQFVCSETDFTSAQIQDAEFTIHYDAAGIAGLDEPSLEPFLFNGAAFSRSGISEVQVNEAANLVTFRSRYAGTFILAAPAGAGDTGSTDGPQGTIALSAIPAGGVAADPAHSVDVTSGVILDHEGLVVSNGTLITVTITAGSILTADAGATTPGVQVATVLGSVAFTVQAPTSAGAALLTATSIEGSAYGELSYAFLPGPAASSVTWRIGEPQGAGPVDVEMTSNPIRDQYGNTVADGTLLTIDVQGAIMQSGDADLGEPGHQAIVINGVAVLSIETTFEDDVFTLTTYADAARTVQLGQGSYSPADYQPMPLQTAPIAAVLAVAGILSLTIRLRRRSPHAA